MACCVSINTKEGHCWIQLINCVLSLMLHKYHISHQTESIELTWVSKDFEMKFSVNQASMVNKRNFSIYRAHSVIEGNLVES